MQKELRALEKYFAGKPEVLFAFLFGSQAKRRAGKISDWDVAVYFQPQESNSVEWEEAQRLYPEENEIWDALVDILKSENIDLVVLNRAPANIAASAITEGIPIVIKDRRAFLDFMLVVRRQAEDYADFVDSYYEISQRSASLTPRDKEKLKKIVDFLEQEISSADYFSKFDFPDYNDIHKRRDIERWVENIINSALDAGEIILASQKKKIPDYYRDVFVQLGLLPEFKPMDTAKFTAWVKLRNILAHEYLDLKWAKISGFAKESSAYFTKFIEGTKRFLV